MEMRCKIQEEGRRKPVLGVCQRSHSSVNQCCIYRSFWSTVQQTFYVCRNTLFPFLMQLWNGQWSSAVNIWESALKLNTGLIKNYSSFDAESVGDCSKTSLECVFFLFFLLLFFSQINTVLNLSLIHIWRCRRDPQCRSRWSPYH